MRRTTATIIGTTFVGQSRRHVWVRQLSGAAARISEALDAERQPGRVHQRHLFSPASDRQRVSKTMMDAVSDAELIG